MSEGGAALWLNTGVSTYLLIIITCQTLALNRQNVLRNVNKVFLNIWYMMHTQSRTFLPQLKFCSSSVRDDLQDSRLKNQLYFFKLSSHVLGFCSKPLDYCSNRTKRQKKTLMKKRASLRAEEFDVMWSHILFSKKHNYGSLIKTEKSDTFHEKVMRAKRLKYMK